MTTLKDAAQGYTPKQTKNVADLPQVSISAEMFENTEAEFPYKYIEMNGEEYRVPDVVLRDMQTMLKENPLITAFKIRKQGEGLKTRYTVIPVN